MKLAPVVSGSDQRQVPGRVRERVVRLKSDDESKEIVFGAAGGALELQPDLNTPTADIILAM